MIGVIDYRAGNSPSVLNALNKIGCEAALVRSESEIKACNGIILPGVGSADATIKSLNEIGCVELLTDLVTKKGIPFLGICVGLQVLFDHSAEGDIDCLGWIPGKILKFESAEVRVPQMGWNEVKFKKGSPLIKDMESGYFYFVNSYYAVPKDETVILGTAEYGKEFCAMIHHKNIFASQCHIEKSGETGLKLLKNFAEYAEGGALNVD